MLGTEADLVMVGAVKKRYLARDIERCWLLRAMAARFPWHDYLTRGALLERGGRVEYPVAMRTTVRSAAASRRARPVAALGIAAAVIVGAAALASNLVPDPLAWAPYPEQAGVSWVWVTAVGSVTFDASFGDITRVDPGGWLRIEERRANEARSIVAVPQAGTDRSAGDGGANVEGSGVLVSYVVDGRAAAWDDGARAWLAQLVTIDTALADALRALERDRSGASGGTLTTTDAAWVSVIQVDPSMLATFGTNLLGWTLFGLGGPHPRDPGRPRLEPGPIDLATEVRAALFVAHQLSAHGLVTAEELEAFLHDLEVQLRELENEATPPNGT